jgi:hypothetical protein
MLPSARRGRKSERDPQSGKERGNGNNIVEDQDQLIELALA